MGDHDSTKQQIINELMLTPQRLAELEAAKTEHTWAHERLKDPDNKFKLLFDQVFDCCVMIDEKGGIVYANEAACGVLGYAKEQLLKLSAKDLYPNEEAEKMQAAASRVLKEGIDYVEETEFIAKNGEMITVEAGAVSLKLADRSYIVYSFRDITGRKRLGEALKESERLFRGMLEASIVGTYIVRDGKFEYVNPRFEQISGYTSDEILGKYCLDLVQPDDREMVRKKAIEHLKGEGSSPYEYRLIHKDGNILWVLERVASLQYKGRPAAVVSSVDITERKMREEELLVKDSAIASSTNAIAISNLEGNVTYVNPSFLRLWGYESDEQVVGRPAIEFWQAGEQVDAAIGTISEKEGWQGEVIALRKDGSAFVAELSASMVADGDGKPMCMMGSLLDITERKRLEEMLRESEELSRGMLAGATVGMYIVQEGKFLYVNPRFEQISGYTMAELSGTDSLEHVHPDDREMVRKEATEQLKGRSNTPYELRYICKDGRTLWCLERVASILYKGKPAAVGSFMDITERKRDEEALRKSEEKHRTLLETGATPIYWVDIPSGEITFVNEKADELFGRVGTDLLGHTVFEFMPEGEVALHQEKMQEAARELKIKEQPIPQIIVRPSGELRYTEVYPTMFESEGKIVAQVVCPDITERKRAEEALQESERLYRLLADNASDVIWTMDMNLRFTYVSPSFTSLLGYSFEEAIALRIEDFLTPDSVEAATKALAEAQATDKQREDLLKARTVEFELLGKDGSTVWTENKMTLLLDPDGQRAGILGVARNITERKRAEEALRKSEERFRALIENASDAVAIINAEGIIIYESPSVERILGYRADDLIGKSMIDLVHPDDLPDVTTNFAELLGNSTAGESMQLRLRHKDGSWRWLEGWANNLFDNPQVQGIVANYRDITDRKKADEALQESEKLYRLLADNASDIIWTMDMNLRFTYVSPSFTSLLGYSFEEAIALRIEDFLTPESVEAATEALAEAQSTDKGGEDLLKTRSVEFELIAKDGTRVLTENNMRLLLDPDGQRAGILGVARNITDRKKAEEALRESEERFRRFVQSAPDIIFRWSVENGLEYASPSAYRVTGYTAEELIADPVLGFEIAKGRELNITADYQQLAEERAALPSREFAFARKDGSEAYLEIRSVPVVDDEGNLVAFEGILRDITERKWAEEQLRRSEEFSSTLLANAPNPILVVNPDTSIRYVNPALEELTGFTFAELVGSVSPYPWWTEETLQETGRDLADAITRGAQGLEQLCKKKNCERFWIELTSTPIMSDGELKYYLASWVDVTERKQVEEALRRSEYKYRSAIESARDGILLVDNDSVILDANRTCVNAVGYEYKEQLIGRSVFDIVASDAPEEIRKSVDEMLNKQGYITNVELMAHSRDGRDIPVEVNISQVFDEKGQPSGAIIVIRDITERKRVQEELLRYTKSLEALHAISATVSQTLDLNEMLNNVLEKVLEVIEIEAGYIHLFDKEKGELVLKVHRGVSEQHAAAVERLEVSEEATQRWQKYPEPAFNTRQILTESAREVVGPAARKEGVATSVSVPLWSKSVMHGGLTLISRTPRRFSPEELELLNAIGNEIAVGIENAGLLEKTRELSATDELTGLFNRRQFYDVLESEMNRMQRYGGCFTLAMLDLDDFKEYNDRFGHTNGDAVLRSLAQTLKTVLRKPDMAFRYGGDEFTIILPSTDAVKAKNIVDRIRSTRLEGLKADNLALEPCLGFSAGIAQFPENAETADGLVFLADAALYRSKRGGGGKSTLVSELGELAAGTLDSATMDQVYALAATVDAKDPHTYGHSKRVATISEMIGKEIALQPKELADLRAAALLHDIGKVGVPDSILTKPGKPTEHEWKILNKHPVEGARIIGYVKELERLVPLIRHHHEWCNGTGYPDGLRGEDIPLGARIISIADAYDTMTTSRPYRDMVSQDEACEELRRCCGTQFDHQLVDAFRRSLNEATVQAATQRSSHL